LEDLLIDLKLVKDLMKNKMINWIRRLFKKEEKPQPIKKDRTKEITQKWQMEPSMSSFERSGVRPINTTPNSELGRQAPPITQRISESDDSNDLLNPMNPFSPFSPLNPISPIWHSESSPAHHDSNHDSGSSWDSSNHDSGSSWDSSSYDSGSSWDSSSDSSSFDSSSSFD
jgi:hypothetical protein